MSFSDRKRDKKARQQHYPDFSVPEKETFLADCYVKPTLMFSALKLLKLFWIEITVQGSYLIPLSGKILCCKKDCASSKPLKDGVTVNGSIFS